jgi:hypothetical protein
VTWKRAQVVAAAAYLKQHVLQKHTPDISSAVEEVELLETWADTMVTVEVMMDQVFTGALFNELHIAKFGG